MQKNKQTLKLFNVTLPTLLLVPCLLFWILLYVLRWTVAQNLKSLTSRL